MYKNQRNVKVVEYDLKNLEELEDILNRHANILEVIKLKETTDGYTVVLIYKENGYK